MKSFAEVFGGEPDVAAAAPGRVNLLGEHTDYNEGFVLPTAIPQETRVALRIANGHTFTVYSANLDALTTFEFETAPREQFARYIYGCLWEAANAGTRIPSLQIFVASDVPIGVGLSSSAALEVATLRALRQLLGLKLDEIEIAKLAQQAEIRHAGVNCGILDQMASSLLQPGTMLFLDTRSLEREQLPLPDDCEVLVIDSGISRSLATTKYNERRAECEDAARRLGVHSLRDIVNTAAADGLPDPLRRRAWHVMSENQRVLRAARGISASDFGHLMDESHRSLSENYEVSTPALDQLVTVMQGERGVYGAKLTGAGFGGACVALCERGKALTSAHNILEQYKSVQRDARLLVPTGM
jgi:galactokinase